VRRLGVIGLAPIEVTVEHLLDHQVVALGCRLADDLRPQVLGLLLVRVEPLILAAVGGVPALSARVPPDAAFASTFRHELRLLKQ